MKVVEIFKSIEGEGLRSGYLSTFIRLYGCNLNCSYCDTQYACKGDGYEEMDIQTILHKVEALRVKRVTLTGGEPLIHDDIVMLIYHLLEEGYKVNIETNGSITIKDIVNKLGTTNTNLPNLMFTVDYKCQDSGMNDRMDPYNFSEAWYNTVYKFVVSSEDDLLEMLDMIEHYPALYCGFHEIYVSPVFGKIEPQTIVEFLLEHNIQNVRLQLQLHKQIWDPETRGV